MEAVMWIMVAMAGACFARPLAQQIRRRRSKANVVDWPLLRMLPSMLANMDRYYDWITELLLSNAGSYHFRGPMFTNMNIFFTADPRNIEHVLRSNFANYPKGPDFIAQFRDLLGDGIFNADGELWRMQRKASTLHLKAPECRKFTEAFVIEFGGEEASSGAEASEQYQER
jgi:fatty acid omega-hydroxylase